MAADLEAEGAALWLDIDVKKKGVGKYENQIECEGGRL